MARINRQEKEKHPQDKKRSTFQKTPYGKQLAWFVSILKQLFYIC